MIKQSLLENQVIWFESRLIDEASPQLFDPDFWKGQDKVSGSAQGRGTTWFVNLGNIHAALRHYRRGGLFGRLVEDRYRFSNWDKTRCYEEMMILDRLHRANVNVPRPVAASAVKTGWTYQADILVEKIPGAKDLVAILKDKELNKELYQDIGKMIAKMHQEQVNHTDLNIHNILLDQSNSVWIIDFDKCRVESGDKWKNDNLKRLLRSFKKEQVKERINWDEKEWQYLLDGYNR
ncbi:3-deoxy-D-manno-octulosonic acid kinase [Vibrio crassostreae]|nr:3-deoxy-D-manno-octulosonic acid kinase [Vibrio crassostreae]CAK2313327.1 3-deoxy-D-manno-octulosonic acid kinase [Vibrio crassostreae]CAK2451924.1 3-deoxy-D-manno-octulosonic acid kinase [Vibrio crassostreae]CAK2768467.1 3-deoxy-D-manno-octulosonic acid kinase [Vibrio crassostreae]